jgi:predicted transcriptional regulator of viral defense system
MTSEEFFLENSIFTTNKFAFATKVCRGSASRSLNARAKKGQITKITRGVWANLKHPQFSPYGLISMLCGTEQGYVSFLSALQRHGVISQITPKIFIATTGHTRRLGSAIASFEFIQMNPKYMAYGIDWIAAEVSYGLATAEKALVDCFYISTRKGNRFLNLPEVDFDSINKKKFLRLLKKHNFPEPINTKINLLFAGLEKTSLNLD